MFPADKKPVTIDFESNIEQTVETVVQHDKDSHVVDFYLVDKGNPIDLTSVTLQLVFVRTEQEKYYDNKIEVVDAVNGHIRYVVQDYVVAVKGNVYGVIQLIGANGERRTNIRPFKIQVIQDISIGSEAVVESDNYPILLNLINDVNSAVDRVDKIGKKATFTFIDDDGVFSTNDMLRPHFDQRGLKMCAGIVCNAVGTGDGYYMTLDQLKEFERAGHEVLCHSIVFDTVTPENHYYVFDESKKYMTTNGFKNTNTFIYPNGNVGENAVAVETVGKQYFDYLLNVTGDVNIEPFNKVNMSRVYLCKDNNLNNPFIKGAIEKTFESGGWCIFYTHSFQFDDATGNGFDLDSYLEIVDYVKNRGGDIATVSEALNRRTDILDQINEIRLQVKELADIIKSK